ncbi:hypothetical protein AB0436_26565 [Streptomyces sp. NPDC051322]|uniref:hypothetical protein n=1 Tax=Streptomyces sp. NPDC051322 TaxID=3154645 RepID=UPI0034510353
MAPSSEIYVQSTDTDPSVRARAVVRQEHRPLRDGLAALTTTGAAPEALVDFCTGELRDSLSAADETLWAPASGAAETRLLVRALRVSRAAIDRHIDELAAGDTGAVTGPHRAGGGR